MKSKDLSEPNFFDQLVADPTNGAYMKKRLRKEVATNQNEIDAGARLFQRRTDLDLSLKEVAHKIGMSGVGYGHLESRFSKLRQQKYLQLLAPVLGVHPDWILYGTELPSIASNESIAENAKFTLPLLTMVERESLGKRARDRRRALNYGLTVVADAIGIKDFKLKTLETCLSVRRHEPTEDKWESVLGVQKGWLRDPLQYAPPLNGRATTTHSELPSCANISEEIRCIGAWLSRKESLCRTTHYELLHPNEQRLANIFAERYGVASENGSILKAIGVRYGVTRERIRQMVDKMVARSEGFSVVTPNLDMLAARLPAILPQAVTKLDEALRPLLGESLSLVSVERFSREVLGRSIVNIVNQQLNNSVASLIVAVNKGDHDAAAFRAVRAVALSMIRSTGAAQIDFVAGAASTELKRGITALEAGRLCSLVQEFEWLVEVDGWFWLGPDCENRLLNVARKVLACTQQRVDVEDIHSAMARSRREYFEAGKNRTYAIDAPHAVLVAALRRTPWIQNIQHDDFRLRETIEPAVLLSESELALYKLLISKGGVAARYTISDELMGSEQYSGSPMAIAIALDASPIFIRLDRGIFALRGASLKAEALAVALAAVGGSNTYRRQSVVIDSEGFISIEFVLSEVAVKSRYWELPAYLAEYISVGDFEYSGETEPVTYTIYPSGSRRLNRFIAKLVRAGFHAGDHVSLLLHPKQRRILFARPGTAE